MWYYILMPLLTFLWLIWFVMRVEKDKHPENVSTRWRNGG